MSCGGETVTAPGWTAFVCGFSPSGDPMSIEQVGGASELGAFQVAASGALGIGGALLVEKPWQVDAVLYRVEPGGALPPLPPPAPPPPTPPPRAISPSSGRSMPPLACPAGTQPKQGPSKEKLATWGRWCERPDGARHGPFQGALVGYSYLAESGEYDNGRKIGHWLGWADSGQKIFQDDYESGDLRLSLRWLSDRPWTEERYRGGKLDGHVVRWHQNGAKREEGDYRDGKKEGLWRTWRDDGSPQWDQHYRNDRLEGLFTIYDSTGQKRSESMMHGFRENGPVTVWHANGQRAAEMSYVDGKLDGTVTQWDMRGRWLGELRYRKGRLIGKRGAPIGPDVPAREGG
jgi:antitoxin component YwqK of YwqJK toxin-antitoxin module